jgi:hypothetical protein
MIGMSIFITPNDRVPALRDKLLVGRDYTRYLPIDRWKPKLPTDLELYNHGTVVCSRLEIDMEQVAGRNGILTNVGPSLKSSMDTDTTTSWKMSRDDLHCRTVDFFPPKLNWSQDPRKIFSRHGIPTIKLPSLASRAEHGHRIRAINVH